MKKRLIINILVLLAIFLTFPGSALAQDYYFRLDQNHVDVYWNEDGTMSLKYQMVFYNDPGGHEIEFVDLGLPNSSFDVSSISANVDGKPVSYISSSEFEGQGSSGVAIALGSSSIPPGNSGTVNIEVGTVRNVLFIDDEDNTYASAVFAPAYFISSVIYGSTDIRVTYHLPPGVQPEEPRWHAAPKDFPEEPVAGHDGSGRITYTWRNPEANGHTRYLFGASFPANYVPTTSVVSPTIADRTYNRFNIDWDAIMGFLCFGSVFGFIALVSVLGIFNERRRKMKYLPPKMRIEGHGIKRGLTAVEAAILMEHPPDKVLTMILFSVIKKGAAQVITQDPLKLEILEPQPEGMRTYEEKFLKAFGEKRATDRRKVLQNLMIALIKSVGQKMKGFSHKETVAYYKKIMEKAWQQVESAGTPEVKSEKFDQHMGWTMLDKDFDTRTQDVFRTGPVYVPMWWGRYDPGWARSAGGTLKSAPKGGVSGTGGGRAPSMPNLPGGTFAASVVGGMQNFAGDVVGNITDFTGAITNKTNPVPKSSRSGSYRSSGGSSCACACACAGCACACAGGGR
jgi:hypothetical protein